MSHVGGVPHSTNTGTNALGQKITNSPPPFMGQPSTFSVFRPTPSGGPPPPTNLFPLSSFPIGGVSSTSPAGVAGFTGVTGPGGIPLAPPTVGTPGATGPLPGGIIGSVAAALGIPTGLAGAGITLVGGFLFGAPASISGGPGTPSANSISFTPGGGPSGAGTTGSSFGGFGGDCKPKCDINPGSFFPGALRTDRVLGAVSVHFGGPFDVGSVKDKHRIAVDGDGRAINSMHISTMALFRMDDTRDGVLCFEKDFYPDVNCFPNKSPVHLQYDYSGHAWKWWAEIPDQMIETPPPEDPDDGPPPFIPTVWTPGPQSSPGSLRIPILGRTLETAMPSILARPLPTRAGEINWMQARSPSQDSLLNLAVQTPITGRLAAFGQEQVGGEWAYTQPPGQSRHAGGTGNGGFVFMPPELDLINPTNPVPTSNALFVAHQGTEFGLGTINRANGTIDTGHSWGDGGNGEFLVKQRATSGGISVGFNSVRINNGRIAFTNLTNFFGEFAHSITANRTWTMPDRSGTVALEPVVRGTTTGETLQRGLATMGLGTTSTSVTFPTPYTATPPQIQVTMERTGAIQSLQISSVTIFGFTVDRSAAAGVATIHWQAVGVV